MPLQPAERAFFEPRFGRDLSAVRVHTDEAAQVLSEELEAQAFTVGRDVYFNAGQYSPWTTAGRLLLAHELTHVLQQQEGKQSVQRKEKKPWKYTYKTQKEADRKASELRDKGVIVYESMKQGKEWGFAVDVLTKEEALAAAKAAADPKYDVTVEEDPISKGWFVRKVLKCPEGMPDKAGYTKWDSCFSKESDATKLVHKFMQANLKAEASPKQPGGRYGIYYAPLTTKQSAEAAAKKDIGARLDKDSPMYAPKVTQSAELKSFVYEIDVSCPKGYIDLGSFRLTVYPLANEKEFPDTPSVKNPCGLKGTFSEQFLFQTNKVPRGVKMEGTGVAKDGSFIHYERNNCFKKVPKIVGAAGTALTPMESVAVDKSVIPLGTELLIESWGVASADDTGGKIKGQHIDLYYGLTVSGKAAEELTRQGKVCKKKTP
jgi:3D (Asp-Asp-Asp) domain-containing protein